MGLYEDGSGGKWVRHRCGVRLWVVVISRLEGMVVVNYRVGSPTGLVVSLCPGCGKPLQLWWHAPSGESRVARE